MKRMFKAVFQQPYTMREISAAIERHLIKPPFPPEWYEVAQSVKDADGRGLADRWREKFIIDEINDVTARPTWRTQKQKLVENILDHVQVVKFKKHMNKVQSDEAKEFLFRGCYDDNFELWEKTSLLAQEFMTSIVSEVVLTEIGTKLYSFDNSLKDQLQCWDEIIDRFQDLKCTLWDGVFLSDDGEIMLAFMHEVMTPILQDYSSLNKRTSRQIAAEDFDPIEAQERYMQIEYKILEVGQHILAARGEEDKD